MIISYGPGEPVSADRQAEHRVVFAAYFQGIYTSTDLAQRQICGGFERGRFTGFDYQAQAWVEVDFYADRGAV